LRFAGDALSFGKRGFPQMVENTVDLGFIAKLLQKNNEEFRALRKEVAEIRTLCVQTYDYVKRIDRRHFEMRDDLELMIKMEIGGAITHVQTVLENNLARLEERSTISPAECSRSRASYRGAYRLPHQLKSSRSSPWKW
jgi:hypothetical protein